MNHGRATTKSPGRSVNRPARTLALRGVGRGGVVRGAGRRGQAGYPIMLFSIPSRQCPGDRSIPRNRLGQRQHRRPILPPQAYLARR